MENIATIGDMENDLRCSQKRIQHRHGNANEKVKRHAQALTLTKDENGFVAAVERFIFGGDAPEST